MNPQIKALSLPFLINDYQYHKSKEKFNNKYIKIYNRHHNTNLPKLHAWTDIKKETNCTIILNSFHYLNIKANEIQPLQITISLHKLMNP